MGSIKNICFFSLIIVRFSYAQTPAIDSLIRLSNSVIADTAKVKLYGDICWELMAVNISKSLYYAEKQSALAKQINNNPLIAQAESDLGNVLNRKRD